MVPIPEEIEALSLEEFSFSILNVLEDSSMPSNDDFEHPPSRTLIPKPISSLVHMSKVGQQSALSLKPLSDRVDVIAKNQQVLAFEQKKMMKQISTMKTDMSSNFFAILAMLFNL